MPCNSDYMEPHEFEQRTNQVARLLIYVLSSLDDSWEPNGTLKSASEDAYPNTSLLPIWTRTLCSKLKHMPVYLANEIIYDGRNKQARELADWWDEHQEADAKAVCRGACVKDSPSNLTYRNLLDILKVMPVENLDDTVTVYIREVGEFYPIEDILINEVDDVLHQGHYYLTME